MATPTQDFQMLIAAARRHDDIASISLAGVIAMRSQRKPPYNLPIAGLDRRALHALMRWHFPAVSIEIIEDGFSNDTADRDDEFTDLVKLLLEHRTVKDQPSEWLAYALATASMSENHLWQDMGLPNRNTLSELMKRYFTPLSSRNTNDMKWKKFFYRELCAMEGLMLCRSPSCSVCPDQPVCFGPEDATSTEHPLHIASAKNDKTMT